MTIIMKKLGLMVILVLFCFNSLLYAESSDQDFSKLDQIHNAWLKTYNSEGGDLSSYYSDQALLLVAKEKYIMGKTNINSYFNNERKCQRKVETITPLAEFKDGVDMYEIGQMVSAKVRYIYMMAWKKTGANWLCELHAFAESTASSDDYSGIDQMRQKWLSLANAHEPKKLVDQLFSKDAVLYRIGILSRKSKKY